MLRRRDLVRGWGGDAFFQSSLLRCKVEQAVCVQLVPYVQKNEGLRWQCRLTLDGVADRQSGAACLDRLAVWYFDSSELSLGWATTVIWRD